MHEERRSLNKLGTVCFRFFIFTPVLGDIGTEKSD